MIKLPPFEPITPPLLPVFSPTLPSIDDVAAGLETLPEQTNSELLNDIETEFLEADGFTCYTPTSSVFKVSSPITSPMRVAPDPETRKIEVPLSPLTPVSATKRVRFSSILATDSGLKIPKEETHHDEVREFEDVVKLRVEQLKREVEQEQLQEADSTMRVPVSVLDFGLPKLAVVDIDAVKAWAQIPRNRWAGIRSLEIALRWAPFSGEARKIPLEPLENDVDPQYFILSDKDIKEAEDTLIKSLESACLDDDSDDEEEVLEPAQFDGKVVDSILDVQELVRRKRRRAREQLDCSATTKKPRPMDKNPSIAERFSAGTSLENFMNMRTRKPVQTRGTPKPGQALSLKPPKSPAGATSKSMLVQPAAHVPRERPIIAFPPPKLGDITKREFFIASTAILASAPFLIRRIRDIYPTATIYERDFSAPLRSAEPLFLNCAAPTLPEADILLSPMAGLVYTTLEVLRQRPLPGQPCLYGSGEQLKARIIGLSTRYERLIVIVKLPIGGAKGSDAGALAGFIGFTAALCRTCTIVIRPVEGIATVPEWVVAAMTDERDVWSGEKGLMEEETTWERLLRKLGLNAYAAQEMAKRLVKLEPEGGLAALLRMDSEEIVARFADVVGGRCVERLVEVLDRRWGERSFSRTAFCFAGGSRRSSLRACRVTLPSSGT